VRRSLEPGGRVAHVVPTDRIAFLLLRTRLQRLQEAGYQVMVVCGDDGYGERLRDVGLRVIHVPFAREISPRVDVRCLTALREVLRREEVDIAHSHNPKGTLLGPVAARWAGVPLVVHTVHGFLFHDQMGGPRRWLALAAERWCAAWAHHLFFQSREDYDFARERGFKSASRLHWIGNGVDTGRFGAVLPARVRQAKRAELGLRPEHRVIGMVGRMVREKGYPEFFRMAGQIAREYSDARFLVVGITEPDQSDAVVARDLLAEHHLQERCVLLEQRTDMPELYACMDVAVLPSHREGIPRALMEASAMGVPVVASDIRGCREVVAHRRTGLLFPVRDVPAFTAAVRALLVDASLRRRLATAGRQRILSQFTEARTAERLTALYTRLAPSAGSRRRE